MDKKPKKITAKIEATHAGIVNGNKFMYIPDGMKSGEKSFVKPYPKPVTDGHPSYFSRESDSPVIGRVIDAEYISYNLNDDFDNLKSRDENMPSIVQKIYDMQCKDEDFKGTGHMVVTAEITDPDAIQQVIDGRKLTVSIGAYMDNARCSVCGSRYGECEHDIGMEYDGKAAFRVGGNMKFDHLAFVGRPADENAMIQSLQVSDSKNEEFCFFVTDEVKIIEYKEEKMLKDKIVDAFKQKLDFKIEENGEVKAFSKTIIDSYESMQSKGRQHSFLFTDSRDIYLKDGFSLALISKVMDDVSKDLDESEKEDFDSLLSIVDALIDSKKYIAREDIDKTIDSNIVLVDNKEEESKEEETKESKTYDQDFVDMIADAVYKKFKQNDSNANKYTKERVSVLESAIIELEDEVSENNKIISELLLKVGNDITKDSLVEYIDKLIKVDDSTVTELEKLPGQKVIVEDSTQPVEENTTDDNVDYEVVRLTYRQKLADSGFSEAKKYLKGLKDNKKIPDNFIL